MKNPAPRFGLDKIYIAGVDAPSSKCCEATEAAQTGWSVRPKWFRRSDHPVRSDIRRLRDILLRSRPPLLCEEGNTSIHSCLRGETSAAAVVANVAVAGGGDSTFYARAVTRTEQ